MTSRVTAPVIMAAAPATTRRFIRSCIWKKIQAIAMTKSGRDCAIGKANTTGARARAR